MGKQNKSIVNCKSALIEEKNTIIVFTELNLQWGLDTEYETDPIIDISPY